MTNDQGRTLPQVRMREERESELRQMLETRSGRIHLWTLFAMYQGGTPGGLPPSGPVLIRAILAREFPVTEAVAV